MITQEMWGSVSLEDLLRAEIAPYDDEKSRISLTGPAVSLAPQRSIAMTMVIHEIVTNAAKYGALSRPRGRVAVSWEIDGKGLKMEWRESHGPQTKKPSRRGFGTELIERQLKDALKGKATFNYEKEGLRIAITMAPAAYSRPDA